MERLLQQLQRIDGKGYKAYKDIVGSYMFKNFHLYIDHVQGDPFAAPSRVRVRVPMETACFPPELWSTKPRRIGLQDFLIRHTATKIRKHSAGLRGTGKGGLITIDYGGQEIVERTALVIMEQFVEARLSVGLPARGRSIMGKTAASMLSQELPSIVADSLLFSSLPVKELKAFVELKEDQEYIRNELVKRNLVCFVADGAILPRQTGVSDKPMEGRVVPFKAPSKLRIEMHLPNRGVIPGMGIPEGVSLIVGGGYHGKSTLLKAIERGVYDHIPGDGREYVITRDDAVKIRAEDGRRVEKVNITPFINNLPFGRETLNFSTDNASGSTSQAANIMEALEAKASLLLLDEDTSATNFMIRDARMQELVAREKEPITPFVDRVRQLFQEKQVSTILVMGGSGDYFDVADLIIMMDEYIPQDVTAKAKDIAGKRPTLRSVEGGIAFSRNIERIPLPNSFQPDRGGKVKVDAKGLGTIVFGTGSIDVSQLEQLVDTSQTRALADLILYLSKKYVDGRQHLVTLIEKVYREMEEKGMEVISPFYGRHPGDYAMPRKQELAGAINRLRTLKVKPLV